MPLTFSHLPAGDPLLLLPKRPKILIVDDQPINIQALYQIFHENHEVFMATSGHQALEFCLHTSPDLILLDVIMPDMDGIEVCQRLKANEATADIPIIFVTSQHNSIEESRALSVGGVDFISKPVNADVVRARVNTQLSLKAQRDLLLSLVFTDGLTGVGNRRRFDDRLETEWRRCWRSAQPIALLMVDIDYFKLYNDAYGHQQGDVCLTTVAKTLAAGLTRSSDVVARYGGEEFVCLLPECDLAGATAKAEALRLEVLAKAIQHSGSLVADVVSISVGVAVMTPNELNSKEMLLAMADSLLYIAKRAGRNRVAA
ncbi:diguanylate cyclase [soil metagenome]